LFCLLAPIADLVSGALRRIVTVTSKTRAFQHLPTIHLTVRDPRRLAACIQLEGALERPHAATLRLLVEPLSSDLDIKRKPGVDVRCDDAAGIAR